MPPPPPPPPRSRALLAVLMVLVTAALGASALAGILLVRSPNTGPGNPAATDPGSAAPSPATVSTPPPTQSSPGGPAPSPSSPSPSATAPPGTEPTPGGPSTPATRPDRPRSAEDHLVRHPFYALRLSSTSCEQAPRPLPASRAGYEAYLGALISCMDRTYGPLVAESGFTLRRPRLLLYTGTVTTPCGESPPGYAVFYCPANETIYATVNALNAYGEGLRLAGYYIVFHEYAHHLQSVLGILRSGYTRNEHHLQISRRVELQADCWMGMTTRAMRSARLRDADRAEMRRWRAAAADDIHGTTAAQLRWVFRGLEATTFRRCSTWRSPPDQVR